MLLKSALLKVNYSACLCEIRYILSRGKMGHRLCQAFKLISFIQNGLNAALKPIHLAKGTVSSNISQGFHGLMLFKVPTHQTPRVHCF